MKAERMFWISLNKKFELLSLNRCDLSLEYNSARSIIVHPQQQKRPASPEVKKNSKTEKALKKMKAFQEQIQQMMDGLQNGDDSESD